MRVTTKGQVTIPVEVRERLGIRPGTEVNFEVEGNTARMIPVRKVSNRGRKIVELMRGKGTVNMTTDEIMVLTRGEE